MNSQQKDNGNLSKAREPFYIGRKSKVVCPVCGGVNVGRFSANCKPGLKEIKCEECGEKYLASVGLPPSSTTDIFPEIKESKGQIKVMRRWLLPKSYPLHAGQNVIGRTDADMPSDISIKNDKEVSRRSIAIEVSKADIGGWIIVLKVLKCANAVLHNDVELGEGDCVSLNYGDSIVLGRTKLRFEK